MRRVYRRLRRLCFQQSSGDSARAIQNCYRAMAQLLEQTRRQPNDESNAGRGLQTISRVRARVDEVLRLYVLMDFVF